MMIHTRLKGGRTSADESEGELGCDIDSRANTKSGMERRGKGRRISMKEGGKNE